MTKTYILDVTCLADDAVFEKYFNKMSDRRKSKVNSCKNREKALLSLGAGVVTDFALREYGLNEKDTFLCFNEYGKPYIEGRNDLFFSLSHSGELAACAVSAADVGVDVEKVRDFFPAVFSKVCTENERRYLESLEDDKQKNEFFRLWTAKESYAKLLGTGIFAKPIPFEFDFKNPPSFLGDAPPFLKEYNAEGYKITVCSKIGDFEEDFVWVCV